MKYKLTNKTNKELSIKKYLNSCGISHRLYTKLKQMPQNFKANGKKVSNDHKLKQNDVVEFEIPVEPDDPKVSISYEPINAIFEDENWLVVDKPAGLTSVPGPSNRIDTLVNRVKGYWKNNQEDNLVPHIITRLDRDTCGLVLIAKNLLSNSLINQQLANHKIVKYYYALVSGNLDKDHDVINLPIGRNGDKIAREVMEDGQAAVTEYWVKQRLTNAALVKVQLHTGRTHQIRVHFAALGHPLLGDKLYQGPMNLGYTHQALEAYYLEFFDDLKDKTRKFELENVLI